MKGRLQGKTTAAGTHAPAVVRDLGRALADATAAESFDETLRLVALQSRLVIGAHQAAVSYIPGGDFRAALHTTSFSEKWARYASYDVMPTGEGIWACVVERRQPMRLTEEELHAHPRFKHFSDLKDSRGLEHPPMPGWLAVPVLRKNGDFLGVVQLADKVDGDFTQADEDMLQRVASLIAPTFELQLRTEELNRANERLRAEETRFRTLVEMAPDGLLLADSEGCIEMANPHAEQILGYAPGELLGKSIDALVPQRFRGQHAPQRNKYMANPSTRPMGGDLELSALRKDGTELPVEIGLSAFEAGDGSHVVAAIRDVTYRRSLEAELERSRDQYQDLYDNAPDMYCSVEMQTSTISECNNTLTDKTGYTKKEILGRSIFEMYHPSCVPDVEKIFRAFMTTGAVHNAELRLRRKDGTDIEVLLNATAVRDLEGTIVHSRSSWSDITALKEAQAASVRYRAELERSNGELEQFAYVASHDLQEPLRMVASYTELLAKRYQGQLDERADKYIHYAVDGARRMQELVADLLALSRIGTYNEPLERVDCAALAADVIATLKASIDGAEAQVVVGELPELLGEPTLLRQVFQNLISNALKFRGEAAPIVHVGAEREGAMWRFSVRDNGIGFDGAHAERIFEIFQRLHARGSYPGTGLGLAIVRKVVQRHEGRLWAESTPGNGATFFFTLPAAPE